MAVHWSKNFAEAYLRYHGLKLLSRNYRCRRGEIDLVMRDRSGGIHVTLFVEVRYRKGTQYGRPEETISVAKQRKLIFGAGHYLQAKNALEAVTQFDVVAVTQPNYLPHIIWIKDAIV
jgi:putative endonuclease